MQAMPMIWLLIVWTASYVLMYADSRYVLPVFSYAILLAATAISGFLDWARNARSVGNVQTGDSTG